MRPWYAANARALLESRQQGMRPDGYVTVSMVGGQFDGPTLYVHDDMPLERMDWRMLAGLLVVVEAGAAVSLERLLRVVRDIAEVMPEDLRLHFQTPDGEAHQVEVGCGWHTPAIEDIPAFHAFMWHPFTLRGSPVEHGLRDALRRSRPAGFVCT
ncbi:MAG: hypothetical protein KF871_10805 [Hydrogenophaga sp.]|uniref:hypothetical protein n=1 Tax=Hydrogenophaga sp. TaxID=1904254 RepID=UPI001D9ADD66|nr:hypothetical protein [Hydrogenophaga sp.]MBX3610371.1 hypothetical protein [Hydrogenophaga sp.]